MDLEVSQVAPRAEAERMRNSRRCMLPPESAALLL